MPEEPMIREDRPSDKYMSESIPKLVGLMMDIKTKLDDLDTERKALVTEYDAIRKYALPDRMDEEGVSNATIKGVGRVHIRADVFANIPAAHREMAYDWLRGMGHGGIIKETVHSGTLKALMKSLIKEGGDLPPDEVIKVVPNQTAVVTRV